jgi:hypothetical protein
MARHLPANAIFSDEGVSTTISCYEILKNAAPNDHMNFGGVANRDIRCVPTSTRASDMKLDAFAYQQLRRLAPSLDDILSAGEVEHVDQAANLAALATLCAELFDSFCDLYPDVTRDVAAETTAGVPVW